ncbi:MAG: dihydrolipoyl dehydrogenase [Planctomycetota bacterium]
MESYDLVVIGSGPGGYVAAIRASQLGLKTAVVEREELGGVCLNWGCIPTKALLRIAERREFLREADRFGLKVGEPSVDWSRVIARSREAASKLSRGVDYLMKKNKIAVFRGHGRFVTPSRIEVRCADGKAQELSATRAIVATGGRPSTVPGVEIDGKKVISSREAMVLPEIPKSMAVVGAGAIGLEFAYFYSAFGTRVTLIEYLDKILPAGDDEICAQLAKSFKKRGIEIHTSSRVRSATREGSGVRVAFEKGGVETAVEADVALMAVGIRGNVEDLGLEEIGVATERSFVKTDDDLRTGVTGVYAIGDVCGQPALAHVASAEGIHAVEHMLERSPQPLDYGAIPACVYCQPQVASVGMTEREAKEKGIQVKVGRFPFTANGKAVAVGEIEGFVKIIAEAKHGEILGAHVIGSEATELVAELGLARSSEITVHDLHHAVHSHPTLSEALMEAAADWDGRAIHI